jgi:TPR repeat protein
MRSVLVALMLMLSLSAHADDILDAIFAYYDGDFSKALVLYEKFALQGDVDAQSQMGYMYSRGKGVTVNESEANRWYRMAAENGDRYSQLEVGLNYYEGKIIPQNFVFAHMWLNLSAAQGFEFAERARDEVQRKMSRQEIAEAQKLAVECLKRKYKDCD